MGWGKTYKNFIRKYFHQQNIVEKKKYVDSHPVRKSVQISSGRIEMLLKGLLSWDS